ncbi:MAG: TetR/AcrR family transcriptional regulator [Acidimicrobiales bacterium]
MATATTTAETTAETTQPIGRPRAFDHDAVLTAVVDLFWEKGFSATSIDDIKDRTGLSKSSIYGAFGSKDKLFRTALDRYLADHHTMVTNVLVDSDGGLDAIDAFFDRLWEQVDCNGEDRGCLAVNTATELGSAEPTLIEFGTRHREFLRDGFTAALERAVELGEFDRHRVADSANILLSVVLGLAVMIRGGATAPEIHAHLDSTKRSLR